MAKFNVENEHVEVEIEKLYKFSPELVYEAWTKKDLLKQWFMTSARTNKEIEADVKEGGKYRIVDQQRNGKVNVIEGIYESLVMDEYVKMTIGMPGLGETHELLEVTNLLQLRQKYFISVTTMKDNTLAQKANYNVYVSSNTFYLTDGTDYSSFISYHIFFETLVRKYNEYLLHNDISN